MFNHVQTSLSTPIFSDMACKKGLNGIRPICAEFSPEVVKTTLYRIKNLAARVQTQNGPQTGANRSKGLTQERKEALCG